MENSSTNAHIAGEDLLWAFYKLFCLRFCVSNDQWKNTVQQRFYKEFERDFYLKIILTLIATNLVKNSFLSLFCPFIKNINKNQVFSKLVVLQQEIVLLFVYNESCSTSKVCRIQYTFIKGFSYMLLLLVL